MLMDLGTAKSGRRYTPLSIDTSLGFPQSFALVFEGSTYHFRLYVNIAAELLRNQTGFLPLPSEQAYLVAHVEREATSGARETVFVRKVTPELEYEAENIALFFPQQRIARSNLNGQGDFGSQVTGGIARRWA
jgi:hypothetical protein